MSSGSKTKTVVKEETGPWKPAVPHLNTILGQAGSLYGQGQSDTYYPFSTTVPFSNQSEAALGMFEDRATNGSPLLDTASQQVSSMMNGLYDTSPTSTYLTGAARGDNLNGNPWLDTMFDHASEKVANRVNSTAGLKGRAGSGAHQQLLQSQLGDLANSIYAQNYQQERSQQVDAISKLQSAWENDYARRTNAIGAAQPLADAAYKDAQILRDVGTHRETLAQAELAELEKRHMFEQQYPWDLLALYNNQATSIGSLGNTRDGTTVTTQKNTMNPLQAFSSLAGTLAGPLFSPIFSWTQPKSIAPATGATATATAAATAAALRQLGYG